jgi:hypothetical protein
MEATRRRPVPDSETLPKSGEANAFDVKFLVWTTEILRCRLIKSMGGHRPVAYPDTEQSTTFSFACTKPLGN